MTISKIIKFEQIQIEVILVRAEFKRFRNLSQYKNMHYSFIVMFGYLYNCSALPRKTGVEQDEESCQQLCQYSFQFFRIQSNGLFRTIQQSYFFQLLIIFKRKKKTYMQNVVTVKPLFYTVYYVLINFVLRKNKIVFEKRNNVWIIDLFITDSYTRMVYYKIP